MVQDEFTKKLLDESPSHLIYLDIKGEISYGPEIKDEPIEVIIIEDKDEEGKENMIKNGTASQWCKWERPLRVVKEDQEDRKTSLMAWAFARRKQGDIFFWQQRGGEVQAKLSLSLKRYWSRSIWAWGENHVSPFTCLTDRQTDGLLFLVHFFFTPPTYFIFPPFSSGSHAEYTPLIRQWLIN